MHNLYRYNYSMVNWIQKAVQEKGSLRKQLNIKAGKTISEGKLKMAAEKEGKIGKRARLAMTLAKIRSKRGSPHDRAVEKAAGFKK